MYDSLGRVSRVERMEDVKISIAMQAGWWGGGGGGSFQAVASSTTGAVLSREATFHDAAGRVDYTTSSTPGAPGGGLAGNVTVYEYDRAGLQTAVIDGVGSRTRFGYDAAGRRQTVTDALGRVTREVLDALGRATRVILADGTTMQTESDAAG